jgi:hypothetical protein
MISASRSTIQDPEVSKNAEKLFAMTKVQKDESKISLISSPKKCPAPFVSLTSDILKYLTGEMTSATSATNEVPVIFSEKNQCF